MHTSCIEAAEGQLVAVTAEGDRTPITELLQRVRRALGVDVVFISQFVGNQRLIRGVATDPDGTCLISAGASDPVEETYCHQVATGRLAPVIPDTSQVPQLMAMEITERYKIGSYVAVPVITDKGLVVGTVCAFCHVAQPDPDKSVELEALESIAALVATALESEQPG